MNWRIKYIIETEAVLEPGSIKFKDYNIRILDCNYFGLTPNSRVIEIIFNTEKATTIEDAYIGGLDIIEGFIDRFCLVSYSKAIIRCLLSVCKEKVKKEEVFEIIQNVFTLKRTLNSIKPEQLEFEVDEVQERYIRLLRFGINANTSEDKFLKHFSLIEQIAEEETTEIIKVKCANCGYDTDTGRKKTNMFIKDILAKYNIDKKEAEKITSYRGKIAHGGGKRNQEYFFDVDTFSAKLEVPAFKEVMERTKSKVCNGKNVHLPGYPLNKNVFKFDNSGNLVFIKGEWKSQGLFSILDIEIKDEVLFGAPTTIPDNYFLPDLD